jgi:hypothetical protein
VARAKRKQHTLAKVHDRRSKDLPRNAEVAPIEVDDPLAQEAGEKIVTMRSLRTIPWAGCIRIARLTRRSIRAAARFRTTGKRPSGVPRQSIRLVNTLTAAGRANR